MVPNCTIFMSSFLGVASSCLRYGEAIGNELLASAVIYFYQNAWAASTTRSYGTGQRRWAKFTSAHPLIRHYPFTRTPLREFELAIAFFAAHLALQPTISR